MCERRVRVKSVSGGEGEECEWRVRVKSEWRVRVKSVSGG